MLPDAPDSAGFITPSATPPQPPTGTGVGKHLLTQMGSGRLAGACVSPQTLMLSSSWMGDTRPREMYPLGHTCPEPVARSRRDVRQCHVQPEQPKSRRVQNPPPGLSPPSPAGRQRPLCQFPEQTRLCGAAHPGASHSPARRWQSPGSLRGWHTGLTNSFIPKEGTGGGGTKRGTQRGCCSPPWARALIQSRPQRRKAAPPHPCSVGSQGLAARRYRAVRKDRAPLLIAHGA